MSARTVGDKPPKSPLGLVWRTRPSAPVGL